MKTFKATIVLVFLASAVSAQTIGFNVKRGLSTFCPDYANFKSTINHAVGFGFYKTRPLNNGLNLRTGVNYTSMRSCLSVTTDVGTTHLIPEQYNYIDIPLILEKEYFRYSRDSRKASHYNLQAGINLAYLVHEEGYQLRVGEHYKVRPLNLGATVAMQWIKMVKWNSSFAIGPQIQAFSTGEELATVGFLAGIKLDWRLGNI